MNELWEDIGQIGEMNEIEEGSSERVKWNCPYEQCKIHPLIINSLPYGIVEYNIQYNLCDMYKLFLAKLRVYTFITQ